jgi:hypothetical protein
MAHVLQLGRSSATQRHRRRPRPLPPPLSHGPRQDPSRDTRRSDDQSTTAATNPAPASALKATPKRTARRPGQTLACGWCGSSILLPARGRVPKWCSSSCLHRAWELTRAAASGLVAVQVIDRAVQVDRPATVNERVEVELVPTGRHRRTPSPSSPSRSTPGRSMTGTCPPSPQPSATFAPP